MMLRIGLLRRKPLEGAWGGVGAPRDPWRMPGAPRNWEETCLGPRYVGDQEDGAPACQLFAGDGDRLEAGFHTERAQGHYSCNAKLLKIKQTRLEKIL